MHSIENIFLEIPLFEGVIVHKVETLTEGKNNQNFKARTNHGDFFIKICHSSEAQGIDRQIEYSILEAVYSEGLGVKPIIFHPKAKAIITEFINAPVWTLEEIKKPSALKYFGEAICKIHTLLPVNRTAYIGDLLDRYWQRLNNVSKKKVIESFFESTRKKLDIYYQQEDIRFCHNDLYYGNFLKGERTFFIDWENAGMNDLYSDLAIFIHFHCSDEAQTKLFLDAYSRRSLDKNKLLAHQDAILLRELLWTITKQQEGHTDFFYSDYQRRCLQAVKDRVE